MEPDNSLVLRLLQEIRSDTGDIRARVTRLERRVDEIGKSAVTAMGFAAHAAQVSEHHGEHFDELRDEIAALKRRVAQLEQARS